MILHDITRSLSERHCMPFENSESKIADQKVKNTFKKRGSTILLKPVTKEFYTD